MASVLIVEDDRDSADALAAILRQAGHEVQCAPNGQEALRSLLHQSPNVIVLDLYMPEMDGVSLLEIIRSYLRWNKLPVVVWTGAADPTLAYRALRLNINSLILKGQSTYDDVVRAVTAAVEGRSAAMPSVGTDMMGQPCRDTRPPS